MTIESSRYLLILTGNGASPTEAFAAIGAQSDGRVGLNAARIDTSNKTSGGWRTGLGGLREFVLDGSGFADWPDTALDRLIAQAIAGNDFSSRAVINSMGDYFQATTQANNLELNGANNNATQWSTTLELSQGTPEFSASP